MTAPFHFDVRRYIFTINAPVARERFLIHFPTEKYYLNKKAGDVAQDDQQCLDF